MRLAATWRAKQEQPELRVFRVPATLIQLLTQRWFVRACICAKTQREVVEGAIGQRSDLAFAPQAVSDLALSTLARNRLAEIRMFEGYVPANKAVALADGTHRLRFF